MSPAPCSTPTMPTKIHCTEKKTCLVIIVSQCAGSSTPSEEIRTIQTLQSKEYHCQVLTHLTLFPKTKMIDNCHRLNRTKHTTRETLSSVERERIPPPENAELALKLNTVSGSDWTACLALNYLIVVLQQAPGFGALRNTHGR